MLYSSANKLDEFKSAIAPVATARGSDTQLRNASVERLRTSLGSRTGAAGTRGRRVCLRGDYATLQPQSFSRRAPVLSRSQSGRRGRPGNFPEGFHAIEKF